MINLIISPHALINTHVYSILFNLLAVTDPKNADYEMESGGTRNYEVWHDEKETNAEFEKQLEEEEQVDSMKALENRVAESQREQAEMDALEEIRAMNQRHVSLMKGGRKMDAAEAVLRAREAAVGKVPEDEEDLNENGLTKDEEDLVSSIKFGAAAGKFNSDGASVTTIRRLDEEDEMLAEKQRREEAEALMAKQQQLQNAAKEGSKKKTNMPVFKVKRKKQPKKDADDAVAAPEAKRAKASAKAGEAKGSDSDSDIGGGALSGLLAYGSDSS